MINEYLDFLKSTKNLSRKTLSAYMTDINLFMRHEKNVLAPNILGYVSFMQSSGLKDSSVKRKIVSLRVFYDYLLSEKIIEISPFVNLKFSFREERRLPKTLSPCPLTRSNAFWAVSKTTTPKLLSNQDSLPEIPR